MKKRRCVIGEVEVTGRLVLVGLCERKGADDIKGNPSVGLN